MKIVIDIKKQYAFILAGVMILLSLTLIASTYINPMTGRGHDYNELGPGTIEVDFMISGGDLNVTDIDLMKLNNSRNLTSLNEILCELDGAYCTQLVNGIHGTSDCIKLGGSLYQDPIDPIGTYFCRLSADGCPSGWTQYKSWIRTTRSSCCGNNGACSSSCCNSKSQDWADQVRDKCTYRSGLSVTSWCTKRDCRSTIREVGCY